MKVGLRFFFLAALDWCNIHIPQAWLELGNDLCHDVANVFPLLRRGAFQGDEIGHAVGEKGMSQLNEAIGQIRVGLVCVEQVLQVAPE
jgi:hypothetical protein